jgi:hypothetical protein
MRPQKSPLKKRARTAVKRAPVRRASAGKPKLPTRTRAVAPAGQKVKTRTSTKALASARTRRGQRRAVKRAPRKSPLAIPEILLEGDTAPLTLVSGPGQRYALGPTSPAEHFEAADEPRELPEAYGTQRLFLAARDPQWVYANWDLTLEQQRKFNALSADGHLIVRVFIESPAGQMAAQVHVHPESRHWFVHVGRAATKYVAELGYNQRKGKWVSIAVSNATLTPPEAVAPDEAAEFVTVPAEVPFRRVLELARKSVAGSASLVEAIRQLRAAGHRGLPDVATVVDKEWTPEQERALAGVVNLDQVRRVWIGSLEITELIRRHMARELASQAAARIAPPLGGLGSVSSPYGGDERLRGFWFNVNAELVLCGATEPDAKVTLGGREVKLHPDGTFSCRFALPDGEYPLAAVATSADGAEVRAANLQFVRATQYRGQVGVHPPDRALEPPKPDHA